MTKMQSKCLISQSTFPKCSGVARPHPPPVPPPPVSTCTLRDYQWYCLLPLGWCHPRFRSLSLLNWEGPFRPCQFKRKSPGNSVGLACVHSSSILSVLTCSIFACIGFVNSEIKTRVYGKRQTSDSREFMFPQNK